MAAPNTRASLLDFLREELKPYDGRLGRSLRMALACVIVVLVAMSQQVPEAALSCYLIFFASRNNAGSGILIAAGLIIAASVGILFGLVFLQLAADEPMLRLSLLVVFTFAGMFFSQASRIGAIAATIGFVLAFVMTLYDIVPIPELLSRGLSWMWVVVFFPMATLILVNVLFGPNPAKLARRAVAERLRMAERLLAGDVSAREPAEALLSEGLSELSTVSRMGGLFGYFSKDEGRRLVAMGPESQRLLALALALPRGDTVDQRRTLVALVDAVELGAPLAYFHSPVAQGAVSRATANLVGVWNGTLSEIADSAEPKAALLAPDAFTNPVYIQFALKALLAVVITYMIYTAWDWFEVHTAMITCFYVALGSAGETLHKSALRIAGCIIGAAMGIGAIYFFMPHMTDIGHLLILVGVGAFIAAWVSNGSGRIQYMGWQMALAFFLCVLQGFSPSLDIAVATNRIIGILIGNVVVALIFLGIWPISVTGSFGLALQNAVAPLTRTLRRQPTRLANVWPLLAEAKRLGGLSIFEANRLRIRSPVLPHGTTIADAVDAATQTLLRLEATRSAPRYLFGAPRCVKAATLAYEASAAQFLDRAASAMVVSGPQTRTELTQQLDHSAAALQRLDIMAARQGGARSWWKRDLDKTMMLYRQLQTELSSATGHVF
ncbi:FUSC family protein [Devosia sp. 2618]|uniref:FUSC family protein n=1 Tax=Devosia sp. 2618 TaxID=3156454 RepID=UPI003394F544